MLSQLTSLLGLAPATPTTESRKDGQTDVDFAKIFADLDDGKPTFSESSDELADVDVDVKEPDAVPDDVDPDAGLTEPDSDVGTGEVVEELSEGVSLDDVLPEEDPDFDFRPIGFGREDRSPDADRELVVEEKLVGKPHNAPSETGLEYEDGIFVDKGGSKRDISEAKIPENIDLGFGKNNVSLMPGSKTENSQIVPTKGNPPVTPVDLNLKGPGVPNEPGFEQLEATRALLAAVADQSPDKALIVSTKRDADVLPTLGASTTKTPSVDESAELAQVLPGQGKSASGTPERERQVGNIPLFTSQASDIALGRSQLRTNRGFSAASDAQVSVKQGATAAPGTDRLAVAEALLPKQDNIPATPAPQIGSPSAEWLKSEQAQKIVANVAAAVTPDVEGLPKPSTDRIEAALRSLKKTDQVQKPPTEQPVKVAATFAEPEPATPVAKADALSGQISLAKELADLDVRVQARRRAAADPTAQLAASEPDAKVQALAGKEKLDAGQIQVKGAILETAGRTPESKPTLAIGGDQLRPALQPLDEAPIVDRLTAEPRVERATPANTILPGMPPRDAVFNAARTTAPPKNDGLGLSLGPARVTSPFLADLADEPDIVEAVAVVAGGSLASTSQTSSALPSVIRADQTAILRQVTEGMAKLGEGSVEIRLSPEELGQVRMQMVPSENGLSVHVSADRQETLDLLRRNIDQLAKDLADAGYDGATFSFGEEGRGEERSAPHGSQPDHVTTEDQPIDQVRRATVAAEGLDLRF
ncbi:flagellar hook-length control protein FliK [Mameliella alba]|nr:flagellar hook-length control protein FliK [Antarctobacter heliothermus]MBY6142592.1 flagellar hook-length control protein FliK [Mameliella alba]MCA0953683.1 flagellar hook-length control protein FliK [Mameliella alba]